MTSKFNHKLTGSPKQGRKLSFVVVFVAFALCGGCVEHIKWCAFDAVQDCIPERRECWVLDAAIGNMEWIDTRQFRAYLPSGLNVEYCCIHGEHFIVDLPSKGYITVDYRGDDGDVIDDRLSFYQCSKADFDWGMSSDEVRMLRFRIGLKHLACIDWYMTKEFQDRRLLMEHAKHPVEGERVSCFCEFDSGTCVEFQIQSDEAITSGTIEYIWQLARLFQFEYKEPLFQNQF